MWCKWISNDPQLHNRSFDIVIEDPKGKPWVGTQYICCTPCVCDMIRYARVEPHAYQGNPIYVFSIPDPCQDPEKIPPLWNRFNVIKKTTNASKTTSGRVIVGLFANWFPMIQTTLITNKSNNNVTNCVLKETVKILFNHDGRYFCQTCFHWKSI